VLNSEVFENNVIKALEDYINYNNQITPLSEDFFNRIEALKQKAKELHANRDRT
jgi:hypothetical protein